MKKALGASLKAEEQAVRSRFEKAETVSLETALRAQRQPEAAVQIIRDNSTNSDGEDELISRLKRRCTLAGINANKREVLHAGLAALDAMRDRDLARLFARLPDAKAVRRRREIFTFVIHPADVVKFRRRAQIRRFQSARQVIIGRKIATITGEV
jgi:hypothetical protein